MSDGSAIMERLAPAKVNLALAVVGRRADGFHDLESWVVPIDWCDRITAHSSDTFGLAVEGACEGVPSNDRNLVWRAAMAIAHAAGRSPSVHLTLTKCLPHGAGLGGGSSDAAATLLLLHDQWQLNWPRARLMDLAATLGSDVPLFLHGGPAIIRGRGELVEPVMLKHPIWIVLIMPGYPVSTPAVYGAWDDLVHGPERHFTCRQLAEADAVIADRLFNDLEAAAFACEPRLMQLHQRLNKSGGMPVRMTGSGSTLFSVFSNEASARAWAASARELVGHAVEVRIVGSL